MADIILPKDLTTIDAARVDVALNSYWLQQKHFEHMHVVRNTWTTGHSFSNNCLAD